MRQILFPIAAALFLSLASFAQPPELVPKPALEALYLAKDDGAGKAGEAASDFLTTDVPLHCVVLLNSSAIVTVKMNLVAVNVLGVRAETKVVSTTYTTKQEQNRVNFLGRPDGKWTEGKYRADIFINNEFVGKLEFKIRKTAPILKAGSNFQPTPIRSSKSPAKKRNR